MPYKEVSSGLYEEVEILCGNYLVTFTLDCDIIVFYQSPASHYNPEEYELKEIKEISNIQVFHEDSQTQYQISNIQNEKIAQEIETNLKVVY